ncbi:hypothetical protein LSAT2_027729 [Lamellibrachia satsuma]|nr:hypothetical protein LSAT2_027729 [Lamellibrachia satsuma]
MFSVLCSGFNDVYGALQYSMYLTGQAIEDANPKGIMLHHSEQPFMPAVHFPMGSENHNYTINITVVVSNIFGAEVSVSFPVKVLPSTIWEHINKTNLHSSSTLAMSVASVIQHKLSMANASADVKRLKNKLKELLEVVSTFSATEPVSIFKKANCLNTITEVPDLGSETGLKSTRHLICGSCSNWVDFVKSGCEKSWAEVQADSFSFECRGCAKMKELEVELEELRLLVVAMVGREQGSCASSSGGGTVDDKVGKDTRDARESSPQPGRKLRGGKVTGHRETGSKETGRKGTGG